MRNAVSACLLVFFLFWLGQTAVVAQPPAADPDTESAFRAAQGNAEAAREALVRAHAVLECWLKRKDPNSHLISERWEQDYWRVENAGADLYASLVVISNLTDRGVRDGFLTQTLLDEQRICNRLGRLPDDWSFDTQGFMDADPSVKRIIFGASEYCRDGLLRITEWSERGQWYDRLVGLVDDIHEHSPHETERGRLPAMDHEVCGEMLQTLARLYWITRDEKYLEWARPIGDVFLLDRLPTEESSLGLSDHGCEIINGLAELMLVEAQLNTERARRYREPMERMLDRVLEVGTNADGMLYWTINPAEGTVVRHTLSDCWGYVYDAYYTYYLATGERRYRDAVERVLRSLPKYLDHDWGGSDGQADSFESAIDLLNRIPLQDSFPFLDATLRRAWKLQRADGSVERWYGDGSFGRACIMYAMWKTKGCQLQPWRADLRLGAEQIGDVLYVTACADTPWTGRLIFDRPRHAEVMNMPVNYPRINELPEWFTVPAEERYEVAMTPGGRWQWSGEEMAKGVALELAPLQPVRIAVRRVTPGAGELPVPATAKALASAKAISYRTE